MKKLYVHGKKVGLEVEKIKKEMKEVRSKKIKHAMKIHKEGRLFGESCLREKWEV